jgi:hypothetical protein
MPLMDTGNYLIWQAIKHRLPPGTRLTSVYRSPADQFKFIVKAAKKHGYAFTHEPVLENRSSWINALKFIREKGYKVAEPGKSMHQQGLAYDFTGPDLQKIQAAIAKAVAEGHIRLVNKPNNLIIETRNNCVHAEIESATLDFEPFEYV